MNSRFYVVFIFIVLVCGPISYLLWFFGRQLNYEWSYKSMVQDTVCEMIKAEHLNYQCKNDS